MGLLNNNEPVQAYVVNNLNYNVSDVKSAVEMARAVADKAASDTAQNSAQIINTRETFNSMLNQQSNSIVTYVENNLINTLRTELEGEIADVEELANSNSSQITQTATNVTTAFTQISNINGQISDINSYIQETAAGILLGKSTSPLTLLITNNGIYIKSNNDTITYWTNEAQLSPKLLSIPQGGNFTIGNFRFVPRSSGNLSLVGIG